jgi:hypothetical protein
MSVKLTAEQRVVLAYYAAHDCGAMRFRGRWVWADEVRSKPDLARRFIQDRDENDYRDDRDNSEMLRVWLAPSGKAVRQ